jgi:hypothetical protein
MLGPFVVKTIANLPHCEALRPCDALGSTIVNKPERLVKTPRAIIAFQHPQRGFVETLLPESRHGLCKEHSTDPGSPFLGMDVNGADFRRGGACIIVTRSTHKTEPDHPAVFIFHNENVFIGIRDRLAPHPCALPDIDSVQELIGHLPSIGVLPRHRVYPRDIGNIRSHGLSWGRHFGFRRSNGLETSRGALFGADGPTSLLGAAFKLDWTQLTGAVMRCQYLNIAGPQPTNKPILGEKNLSKIRIVHFRNNSS